MGEPRRRARASLGLLFAVLGGVGCAPSEQLQHIELALDSSGEPR